jgi:predicted amidophosphoribosyltransferase
LIDDVHTTGATLADCARALRAAGAATVGAACFARVLEGSGR